MNLVESLKNAILALSLRISNKKDEINQNLSQDDRDILRGINDFVSGGVPQTVVHCNRLMDSGPDGLEQHTIIGTNGYATVQYYNEKFYKELERGGRSMDIITPVFVCNSGRDRSVDYFFNLNSKLLNDKSDFDICKLKKDLDKYRTTKEYKKYFN